MERNRILQLAIEELERQKATLTAEIDSIRSQMKGTAGKAKAGAASIATKGPKSTAARKAQSQRMKKYWAAKRAKAAKQAAKPKASPSRTKARAKTEAEKKALSLKMKEVWKKRKAEAAKSKG